MWRCNILYAKIWTMLRQKSLDRAQDSSLTRDRIICGSCYKTRLVSITRKAKTGKSTNLVFRDKHNDLRKPGQFTWQERADKDLGDEPFSQTKLLLPYLLRVGWTLVLKRLLPREWSRMACGRLNIK